MATSLVERFPHVFTLIRSASDSARPLAELLRMSGSSASPTAERPIERASSDCGSAAQELAAPKKILSSSSLRQSHSSETTAPRPDAAACSTSRSSNTGSSSSVVDLVIRHGPYFDTSSAPLSTIMARVKALRLLQAQLTQLAKSPCRLEHTNQVGRLDICLGDVVICSLKSSDDVIEVLQQVETRPSLFIRSIIDAARGSKAERQHHGHDPFSHVLDEFGSPSSSPSSPSCSSTTSSPVGPSSPASSLPTSPRHSSPQSYALSGSETERENICSSTVVMSSKNLKRLLKQASVFYVAAYLCAR